MIQTYEISGMTCNSCVKHVHQALEAISGINEVRVDLSRGEARIGMNSHVKTEKLQKALDQAGNYTINELHSPIIAETGSLSENIQVSNYKRLFPLFLIFAYLILGVGISQFVAGEWNGQTAMKHFMGGFFLVFSFFKLLDLKGFAYAFAGYDPIAKRWLGYAFVYPFVELSLGIAYLGRANLFLTNIITLVIVGIGTIGVGQALLRKNEIQCACLGTVFNLPMTKVTLTENSLMIIMALLMLLTMP